MKSTYAENHIRGHLQQKLQNTQISFYFMQKLLSSEQFINTFRLEIFSRDAPSKRRSLDNKKCYSAAASASAWGL